MASFLLPGIDVEQVSVVINFDLPVDKDGTLTTRRICTESGVLGDSQEGIGDNMGDSRFS